MSAAADDVVDPTSPTGKIYLAITDKLLAAEIDRRKQLEGRAAGLLTASGAILALIFGLSVLVTGKDYVYESFSAVYLLVEAMITFLLSAVIAIVVQAQGYDYNSIHRDTLRMLTRDQVEWERPPDDATRAWVSKQVSTICSMRVGNGAKQIKVECSLWLQITAIGLLASSVGFELVGRVIHFPALTTLLLPFVT